MADPRLLCFCPISKGGIADYAHQQAIALSREGWRVTLLCPPGFPHDSSDYVRDASLPDDLKASKGRLRRAFEWIGVILAGIAVLVERIREDNPGYVLMATYSEYAAPLWAWRLRKLRKSGVVFGAVVHDPVRDFVVGPPAWHRWSVSEGYSYLDHAFVHESIVLDTGSPGHAVPTHIIPHGPYPFPDAGESRAEVRRRLGIPEDAELFLSFGHLRDGKNLALILEAMSRVPDAWLLVAGTEAGTGNRTSAEYREMAETLGVGDRCRWVIGFATAVEAANFFTAADFALLTYQASFRSASGVLNVAVRYRKPVLASCGESNLATSVERYSLGLRVPADDMEEIAAGMRGLLHEAPAARWDDYERENSWQENARLVTQAFTNRG